MPAHSAANLFQASSCSEVPALDANSSTNAQHDPTSILHNGPPVADSSTGAIVPPTLTPATTTRQSVALGVLSTLWASNSNPTVGPEGNVPFDPSIPTIVAHAPSPDAQEPPSELTTSTSSIPSTTTTLTNTLPPTQSAALRALNAPAFQAQASSNTKSKPAKSTSSRTSLSSQPVVVRTYSGSRHGTRTSSGITSPNLFSNMNGHLSSSPSALSAGLAGRSETLPSVEDFSFSAILRAVDPEIRDAIDAIAEICARSRMSLADEYDAHLPPQGEITGTGPGWASGMGTLVGRGRIPRLGQAWSAAENALTAVPEASSSSERLAGESRERHAADIGKKRSQSAYGSLKSVISGGSGRRKRLDPGIFEAASPKEGSARNPQGPAWSINTAPSASSRPSIVIATSPQASKQLSLDSSSTIKNIQEPPQHEEHRPKTSSTVVEPKQASRHKRHASSASNTQQRTRSGTLTSLTSWIPWPRSSELDASSAQELTKAEAKLREMLVQSETSALSKGKAPLQVE